MTTETEAMRESFEWTALNALKWNKRDLDRNRAGDYENEDVRAMWLCFQAGHAAATAETAAAVAAERELAAQVCDRIADDYNERERFKYAELRTDAQTGAEECACAIRAGAKEPSDG